VHAWHQFAIRHPDREALRTHLANADIQASILYPTPVHKQPAYEVPGLSLPATEAACASVLCLPCHPGLTTSDIDRVAREVLRWAGQC
jgi:dTDP-4-amino-4,6-dideoxygalactose transaminase